MYTRSVSRAGPNAGLAGLGPNFCNRAGSVRARPNDFLIREQSGPDYQSFKDPGRIQLKNQLKNSKFSHFKIIFILALILVSLIFSTIFIICL